ncbi:hypothetical protein Tco_0596754 [Tanacetum coccineum]
MADDQPMWGNNRAVAPTHGAAIVTVDLGDNFTVKGHHLSMIKDRKFDGRAWADPHKHIIEFVEICRMFQYGTTNADAIKLKLFPSSLSGDAKVWFNELSPGVIVTREQTRQAFDLLHSCHEHGLGQGTIIQIFYHELDKVTQAIQDAGGIVLYKTNEVHQLLEDRVLLKLDWSKDIKAKPIRKTISFAKSSNDSKLIEKMEALTTKNDSQFKDIKGEMKEMRDGCNSYEGPHPSSECDDKPMGGLKDEEAHYAYGGYRGGGYRGNYYDEVDEAEKEAELIPSKQTKSDLPPLKAYKPKIPYPQRLRKEKMEELYAKFIDLVNEVKINVPLVDVLAEMPNYEKFLKDLTSNKKLNLGVGDDRIAFLIDKAMQHSHSNDDTCFRMYIIDEVIEEELDALLDDSKPFLGTLEKISESSLDHEIEEFMEIKIEEIPKQEEEVEDNFEELPLEENLRIKNSIQDPSTDLVMKPLPKHLEYAFMEKQSILPVVISTLLKDDERSVLFLFSRNTKKHLLGKHPTFQELAHLSANIKSTLRTTLNLWDIPLCGNMSWGWRKILQLRPAIREFIWCKIRDVAATYLWYDKWCELGPLSKLITSRDMCRAGLTHNSQVIDIIQDGAWNWPHDLLSKYPILSTCHVPTVANRADCLVWRDSQGADKPFWWPKFGTTFGQEILKLNGTRWFGLLHASLGMLLTYGSLLEEKVWDRVKGYAGLDSSNPNIYDIIFDLIPIARRCLMLSIVAKLVVAALTYYIWQERNWRLFKKAKRNPNQICECIRASVLFKLMFCKFNKSRSGVRMFQLWELLEAIFV